MARQHPARVVAGSGARSHEGVIGAYGGVCSRSIDGSGGGEGAVRRLEGEQPQVCDRCGGDAFRPATRREQLVRWFTHGAGAGTAWYCRSCSASWSGGSSYRALYRTSGAGWRRWARLPLDVLEAVRAARSWHPVPVFYAAVGTIALVPAVAVAALTRVRWWVALVGVPVTAMVVAFLWSLATAVGRGRRDVLRRLAPERAWRQDLEDELAGIREQIGGFRLLAPEAWPGELSLGGCSWSIPPRGPRVLRGVTVVADQGDPQVDPDSHAPGWRPPTPRVEVRVTRDTWDLGEDQALHEFVERAFPASPPNLEGVEPVDRQEMERRMSAAHQDREQQRRRREAELAERWRDGSVQVDGVAIAARLLTHDDVDVWVATFSRDGHGVMLVAQGTDPDTLTLGHVADPTPLVDGFERRRRRVFAPSSG